MKDITDIYMLEREVNKPEHLQDKEFITASRAFFNAKVETSDTEKPVRKQIKLSTDKGIRMFDTIAEASEWLGCNVRSMSFHLNSGNEFKKGEFKGVVATYVYS